MFSSHLLGCKQDKDCVKGRVCKNQVCVKPPEKYPCTRNRHCPSGKNCVNGYCVNLCRKDKDCKPPDICYQNVVNICQTTCVHPGIGGPSNTFSLSTPLWK